MNLTDSVQKMLATVLVLSLIFSNLCYGRFNYLKTKANNGRFGSEGRARIVNGMPTTTEKWPWIVSLRLEQLTNDHDMDKHFCGGSIIRRTKPAAILTAAHCVEWLDSQKSEMGKSWNVWVDIGRDDVSFENYIQYVNHDSTLYDSYKMIEYVYHENITYDSYYKNTAIEDVGIVFIDVELPQRQSIITLNTEIDLLSDGDDLIVIGYGVDAWKGELTDTLEQTDLKFINDTACNIGIDKFFVENWPIENYTAFLDAIGIEYGNMDQYPYNIIQCQECVLCAIGSNTDACNGDSGSPLIIGSNFDNAIQVGIVSFGFECNAQGVPAQYTDVAYYYQWIQHALSDYQNSDTAKYNSLIISSVCVVIIVLV